MNQARRARIEFFADQGGHCTPPGRMVCAKSLADAEEWSLANNVEAVWEWDSDADLSWADEETMSKIQSGEYEVLSCTLVADDEPLASLFGIIGADSDYRRVVEAELASEAMERPRAYRVTVTATVEADSAEEAQLIAGNLLAGRRADSPSGPAFPLTGVGSWAPETKTVERIA